MRYIASRLTPNVAELTIEKAMDRLEHETKDLIENIFDKLPQVKIIQSAPFSCALIVEVPDEKTAEELAKVCNCNMKKIS